MLSWHFGRGGQFLFFTEECILKELVNQVRAVGCSGLQGSPFPLMTLRQYSETPTLRDFGLLAISCALVTLRVPEIAFMFKNVCWLSLSPTASHLSLSAATPFCLQPLAA